MSSKHATELASRVSELSSVSAARTASMVLDSLAQMATDGVEMTHRRLAKMARSIAPKKSSPDEAADDCDLEWAVRYDGVTNKCATRGLAEILSAGLRASENVDANEVDLLFRKPGDTSWGVAD